MVGKKKVHESETERLHRYTEKLEKLLRIEGAEAKRLAEKAENYIDDINRVEKENAYLKNIITYLEGRLEQT